jgi:hypothetical protein
MVMGFRRKAVKVRVNGPGSDHDSVIAFARILVRAIDRDPELQR